MPMEHWGTLSVKDHLDTHALIADLLLYIIRKQAPMPARR
jgi:hypothetical protein